MTHFLLKAFAVLACVACGARAQQTTFGAREVEGVRGPTSQHRKAEYSSRQLEISNRSTLALPKKLAPAMRAEDVDLLIYALEKGYGGKGHFPQDQWDDVLSALAAVADRPLLTPQAFCDAVGDALAILPDAHLSARAGKVRCGHGYKKHRREPNVGANFYAPTEGQPIWRAEIRKAAQKRVSLFSITRFSAGDDPVWNGFSKAVDAALKNDAIVIDMRGNGGGDDTRGFELARKLLGKDGAPGYMRVHHLQSPESITLQLNWIKLGLLRAAIEKSPPPHTADYFRERQALLWKVIEGTTPDRIVEDVPDFVPPNTRDLGFKGEVFVLADSACASSCESSLEVIKRHPRARFVGQRTAGYIHFGNVGALVLPHSQIFVYIPTKYNEYADGAFYDKIGFEPDIKVQPGHDALDVVLSSLSQK